MINRFIRGFWVLYFSALVVGCAYVAWQTVRDGDLDPLVSGAVVGLWVGIAYDQGVTRLLRRAEAKRNENKEK